MMFFQRGSMFHQPSTSFSHSWSRSFAVAYNVGLTCSRSWRNREESSVAWGHHYPSSLNDAFVSVSWAHDYIGSCLSQ